MKHIYIKTKLDLKCLDIIYNLEKKIILKKNQFLEAKLSSLISYFKFFINSDLKTSSYI